MYLRTLSDDEFLRHASTAEATDLERELLLRFEARPDYQDFIRVLADFDFDTEDAENLKSELQRIDEAELIIGELREQIANLEAQIDLV